MQEFTYSPSMSGLTDETARAKARWIEEAFRARNKAEFDNLEAQGSNALTPELAATGRVVGIFRNVTNLDAYEAAIRLVLRGMSSAARLYSEAQAHSVEIAMGMGYPPVFHAVMGEVYRDCLNNYILNFNWQSEIGA